MTRDVLLLTPTWGGNDGLSVLAGQYGSALHELTDGHVEVWTLVDRTTDGGTGDAGPRVRSFDNRRGRLGRAALGSALTASRYRLVVTLHVNQLGVAAPLVLAGAPLAHVIVGIESWTPIGDVRAAVLRRAAQQLAISTFTLRQFASANPDLASRAARVIHPHTPALAAATPAPSIAEGCALMVARMSAEERYKGHDRVIDLWRSLRQEVADARLVCAGGGDDLPRLRDKVARAGLTDAIIFSNAVAAPDLAAMYRDCAFFVLPSRREGFGLVFLEAMAAGRACLGAPGSAEEIIVSDRTGFIADDGDDATLVARLAVLFRDRELRNRFGAAGCQRASHVFSRSNFVRQLEDALASVI